ncbi:carbohydrate-binding protein [Vallitalea guaymasensis]|uniref:carbohydrate-binding protein n=1 Tax=Vallitalea guaymasensis TaxID=1185412 RepID=UPI002356459F|nr:carbohydrate-binding protein [Vallitalea guaymasensis]
MKKKYFRNLLTCIICLILAFNVGSLSISAQTTNDNVQLYSAKLETGSVSGDMMIGNVYYSTGIIHIKDLGVSKNVSVHYTYNGNDWFDQPAVYVKTLSDGSQVWRYRTPNQRFMGCRYTKCNCKFAVKYEVGGNTYWDNNNGNDYFIERGKDSYYSPIVLSKSVLTLDNIWCLSGNKHSLNICLMNLGYDKTVKVRYSNDNWQSYKESLASYKNTNANGIENWTTIIDVEEDFEFCIGYTVNGVTYWDNNFELNYRLYNIN